MRKRLLDFFDPGRSIPLFIIGTAALSLALQAVYDFANEPDQFQGGYWLALAALLIAVLILIVSTVQQRFSSTGRIGVKEELQPGKRAALILLAGPTEAAAPASIQYHLPTLKHCWIIATRESQTTAVTLANRYRDQIAHIYYGEPNYLIDPDQIQSTYDMVVRILDVEAVKADLPAGSIIADLTGGTKPMTAGMALACLARNRDMQYMKVPRDEVGQVLVGATAEPIRIDATFIPAGTLASN